MLLNTSHSFDNENENIGVVNLQNRTLQCDTMSSVFYILCIDPIMNELDKIVKEVEIKKRISDNETKIIHIWMI